MLMCLAIPGKVTKINGRQAWVQYPNSINKALISDPIVKTGDYVMVQMGIIVKKLTPQEAKLALKSWQ